MVLLEVNIKNEYIKILPVNHTKDLDLVKFLDHCNRKKERGRQKK